MMPASDHPKRKQTRLKEYDYSNPGAYFVTICTKRHKPILGNIKDGRMVLSNTGIIVDDILKSVTKKFETIEVDYYIIMPNHIHVIINIKGSGFPTRGKVNH